MSNRQTHTFGDDDYQFIACKSSLKGLLKAFKGKGELAAVIDEISRSRSELAILQQRLVQSSQRWPVRYMPLLLCRSPARSGATFLRWRNIDNNRSGLPAMQEILASHSTNPEVKEKLLTMEYERQLLNSQVSVLTFVLRQLKSITPL